MSVTFNETKTIQTANRPDMIDLTNRRNGYFGWNVQNVQITHVKDSHLEFQQNIWDVTVRSVTETTEYATITYTRDRSLPRLQELRALEEKYEGLEREMEKQLEKRYVKNRWSFHALLLWIPSAILSWWSTLATNIFAYGGIGLFVIMNVVRMRNRKAADAEMEKIRPKMRAVEKECEAILVDMMH